MFKSLVPEKVESKNEMMKGFEDVKEELNKDEKEDKVVKKNEHTKHK